MVQGPNPLNKEEVSELKQAAEECNKNRKLIILTGLETGMRIDELCHMREGWLELNGIDPQVRVPAGEMCDLGRDGPCSRCRDRPDKDWAPSDADFTPKTESSPRPIPVYSDALKDLLNWWFEVYDSLGVSLPTARRYVNEVVEEADLDRNVTPHDLRDTYGTMLAAQGFDSHAIKDAMGHSTIHRAEKYVKLSGRRLHDQFQRNIDNDGLSY